MKLFRGIQHQRPRHKEGVVWFCQIWQCPLVDQDVRVYAFCQCSDQNVDFSDAVNLGVAPMPRSFVRLAVILASGVMMAATSVLAATPGKSVLGGLLSNSLYPDTTGLCCELESFPNQIIRRNFNGNVDHNTGFNLDDVLIRTSVGGRTYSLASVGDATHGSVSLSDGKIVFQADEGYVGLATYTASVLSSSGGLRDYTINVWVGNRGPQVGRDKFSTGLNTGITITRASLLENDTDPNGDPLRFTRVSKVNNGTLCYDSKGNIVFFPKKGFSGTASFRYLVTDGKVSNSGLVKILVSASPS